MGLSAIQRKHFKKMSVAELNEVILDAGRQMNFILLSQTKAGEAKRAELQARIDYCTKLKYTRK